MTPWVRSILVIERHLQVKVFFILKFNKKNSSMKMSLNDQNICRLYVCACIYTFFVLRWQHN